MKTFFDKLLGIIFFSALIAVITALVLTIVEDNTDILISLVIPIWAGDSLLALYVFSVRRNLNAKLSWVMTILCLPVVGAILYLVFGRQFKNRTTRKKWLKTHHRYSVLENRSFMKKMVSKKQIMSSDWWTSFDLAATLSNTAIQTNNSIAMLKTYTDFLQRLVFDIRQAKNFIHMEYYIIRNDWVFKMIVDELVKKIKDGVKVRIVGDWYGSSISLKRKTIRQLRLWGIQYAGFHNFVFPFFDSTNNYRNHRKNIIIDNRIAYVGGNNIGNEYCGFNAQYGTWIDIQTRYVGPVVRSVSLEFLYIWHYCTGEEILNDKDLLIEPRFNTSQAEQNVACVINQSPESTDSDLLLVYFRLFSQAKKSIKIATPYFVPTSELIGALKAASSIGLSVEIVLPGISDQKKFVWHFNRSFYNELLEANIKISEHPCFIHSKLLIIDDEIVLTGTANFDLRSFFISFETQMMIYGPVVNQYVELFDQYLSEAKLIERLPPYFNSWFFRIYLSFLKIFMPIF